MHLCVSYESHGNSVPGSGIAQAINCKSCALEVRVHSHVISCVIYGVQSVIVKVFSEIFMFCQFNQLLYTVISFNWINELAFVFERQCGFLDVYRNILYYYVTFTFRSV